MLIVGAKGFAKELLEIFHQIGKIKNLYFFDDKNPDTPKHYNGITILKSIDDVKMVLPDKTGKFEFSLGIGGCKARKKLTETFIEIGGTLSSVISPRSTIGHYGVEIGLGTNIMSGVIITNEIKIGRGSLINLNTTIGHDSVIGNFVEMSPGVHVSGNCKIGNECSIGTGAAILPNVTIGNNVVIGAGAVVTKDVEDNSLMVGVPAKRIRFLDTN